MQIEPLRQVILPIIDEFKVQYLFSSSASSRPYQLGQMPNVRSTRPGNLSSTRMVSKSSGNVLVNSFLNCLRKEESLRRVLRKEDLSLMSRGRIAQLSLKNYRTTIGFTMSSKTMTSSTVQVMNTSKSRRRSMTRSV